MGEFDGVIPRILTFVERHARTIAVVLVLVASARIAMTWSAFNATADECAHIACGMEWLDRGTYLIEDQHPPLARVAAALGPYLFGARSQGNSDLTLEGKAILLSQGRLERTLTLARAGILPFFWIACIVVFIWARRLMGAVGGVFALAIFTHTPPVLAHAGLATTDMALAAMLGATALVATAWIEHASVRLSLLLGAVGSLAVLSKFSSLPFFAAGAAFMLIWHVAAQPRIVLKINGRRFLLLCLSCIIACLVIWMSYRFTFGPVRNRNMTRPAPEFFSGIKTVRQHNTVGHLAYLLGSWSQTGFRDYYLVDFAVKTPTAFLVLLLVGSGLCVMVWRRHPEQGDPLLFSLGIFVVAVTYSQINIGIRHILPVYVGFSVVAAGGLIWLLQGRLAAAGIVLISWLAITAGLNHPDYLAYFNEIAGANPERIVIDSDLDWGQDMKRLAIRLKELRVRDVSYLGFLPTDLSSVEFPAVHEMDIQHPSPGWYAANITILKMREHDLQLKDPDVKPWPESIAPSERIGKGILLWHIDETNALAP